MNIPQHVAIILDGNGRWAKSKGMPRNYGHARGAKNLEKICRDAYDIGIKYLTVYLFSTENWKRSREEVDGLMKLFRSYTKTCIKTARENNMKVRVLGDFRIRTVYPNVVELSASSLLKREDFQQFLLNVSDDTVLVVTDINLDAEYKKVWLRLVADNCTVLTFDLVDCGIVFFDKTKFKQNFNVNY